MNSINAHPQTTTEATEARRPKGRCRPLTRVDAIELKLPSDVAIPLSGIRRSIDRFGRHVEALVLRLGRRSRWLSELHSIVTTDETVELRPNGM